MDSLEELLHQRRTIYALGKDIKVSDKQITDLVEKAVKYVPSAFNMQSQRVVLLFGKEHDKLWDITKETLRKIVPPTAFGKTEAKIDGFKAAYGTVLYFNDDATTRKYGEDYPLYKDNFVRWSEHGSGMLQLAVWVGLSHHGLGASLQHYNPLIDDAVHKEFNIPSTWSLIAEMPFGQVLAPADPNKTFLPLSERVLVRK